VAVVVPGEGELPLLRHEEEELDELDINNNHGNNHGAPCRRRFVLRDAVPPRLDLLLLLVADLLLLLLVDLQLLLLVDLLLLLLVDLPSVARSQRQVGRSLSRSHRRCILREVVVVVANPGWPPLLLPSRPAVRPLLRRSPPGSDSKTNTRPRSLLLCPLRHCRRSLRHPSLQEHPNRNSPATRLLRANYQPAVISCDEKNA
jgi:hypothetical protein